MLFTARRVFAIAWFCMLSQTTAAPVSALAQDTTIFIQFEDRPVFLGQTVAIPLWIANYAHPIAGYSVMFAFDRPGLLVFGPDSVADSTGTLSSGWEYFEEITYSAQSARITGIADINLSGDPDPIPPLTLGETLVLVHARVPCDADTISGTVAHLAIQGLAEFSDPNGDLILPVSAASGTLTVQAAARGDLDHSGVFDVLDVVLCLGCAFRGQCPPCDNAPADLNCDGTVNVQDVVAIIGTVFRGAPLPLCP